MAAIPSSPFLAAIDNVLAFVNALILLAAAFAYNNCLTIAGKHFEAAMARGVVPTRIMINLKLLPYNVLRFCRRETFPGIFTHFSIFQDPLIGALAY